MQEPSDIDTAQQEIEGLKKQVAELQQELFDQAARTNQLVAEAQKRGYWLDRWQIDLNSLMQRPIAGKVLINLKVFRGIYRAVKKAFRKARNG